MSYLSDPDFYEGFRGYTGYVRTTTEIREYIAQRRRELEEANEQRIQEEA